MNLRQSRRIKLFLLTVLTTALALIPHLVFAQDNQQLPDPNLCYAVSDGYFDENGTQFRDSSAQDTLAFLSRITGDTNPVDGSVANVSYTTSGNASFNMEAIAFAPAGTVLYGSDADQLGTLNLANGDFTPLPNKYGTGTGYLNGSCTASRALNDVDGLSFDVTTNTLYGSERTTGTPDVLFIIDQVTGKFVPGAMDHPTCGPVDFVEVQPQIDPGNADKLANDVDDIAVDPATGTLYGILNKGGAGGMLGIIDKNSGETTVVGNFIRDGLGTIVQDMEGLAFFNNGVMYGSTGKSFGSSNLLWKIDKATGVVMQVGQFTNNMVDIEAIDCLSARVAIDVEKHTNDQDADQTPGPFINQGDAVAWKYYVRNTGSVALTDIEVTDDLEGAVCTIPTLDPGALQVCELSSTAQGSQYANLATATGVSSENAGVTVGDQDPSHYYNVVPPAVGDYVWHDIDEDGVQDAFEPGVGNVVVRIFNASDDSEVAQTTTDGQGYYVFDSTDGLTAGDYYVKFELPGSFSGFSPANNHPQNDDSQDSDVGNDPSQGNFGRTATFTLQTGSMDFTWDAGLVGQGEPAALGNFVWEDLNANGIQEDGEPGVGEVLVKLLNPTGGTVKSTTTDGSGFYEFIDLAPGDYRLEFTLPSGYVFTQGNQGTDEELDSDTDPTNGLTALVTLLGGQTDNTWDSGLVRPASLGDQVWEDSNNNGIQDDGEPGKSSITVKLLDEDGNEIASTVTDANGNYSFTDLTPDTYIVEFVAPDGFTLSPQDKGGDESKDSDADPNNGRTAPITLSSGESNNDVDAGLFQGQPTIAIVKTADKTTIHANNTVVYSYAVSNPGNVALKDIEVADNFCQNVTFVDGDTNNDGLLDLDETWNYSCSEILTSDTTNIATATGKDPKEQDVEATDNETVDVIDPGIQVVVTPDQTTVSPGTDVVYTYEVTNEGDVPLKDVILTDDSCSPVTLVSGDSNNDGLLDLDETWVYTCTGNITEDTTNTATVKGTDPLDGEVADDDDAFVDVINGSIEIAKSVDNSIVSQGGTATYAYEVKNLGDVPLSNVVVTDDKCAPLNFTGGDDNSDSKLDTTETWSYSCATALVEDTTNTAKVTAEDPVGTPVEDSDMVEVDVIDPQIKIVKSADKAVARSGESVVYTLKVTNEGDDPLSNVQVADDSCSPVTLSGGDDNNDGILNVDEIWSYSCTAILTKDTTNVATAKGTDSLGNEVPDEDTSFVDIINPGISVEKTVDKETANVGDTVIYTYKVNNTGDDPLQNVTASDDKCAPVTYSDGDSNSDGILDVDETWSFTCTQTITEDTINTATVKGDDSTGQPVEDGDTAEVDVIKPGIAIEKSADAQVVAPNTAVLYTYKVVNTGDVALNTVNVSDDKCSPVAFVSGDTDSDTQLDVDETWTYTCSATLTEDTTNVATVTAKDPLGNDQTGKDDYTVDVVNPGIQVEKSASATVVDPGTSVVYTYKVSNTGDDALSNVTVSDDKCSPVSLDGGDTNGDTLLDTDEVWSYSCTAVIDVDTTNVATAQGTDSTGTTQSDKDEAFVDVTEPVASLGDFVWEDLDGDGVQDAGEAGVEGVTVNLVDSNGNDAGTTTTDVNGKYEFTNLVPGSYTVFFIRPAGYAFSPQDQGGDEAKDSDADATGETAAVTLGANENNPDIDAGIYKPASISGIVWDDVNRDGIENNGEAPLPGVTVNLRDADGQLVDSVPSGPDGSYTFENLPPGSYTVEVEPPADRVLSPQDQGSDDTVDSDFNPVTGETAPIVVQSGEDKKDVDAGLNQPNQDATLGDRLWNDQNRDGIQDNGEPGVPDVTVTLLDENDSVVATTTTDGNGNYNFTAAPGTYRVVFELPLGFQFTTQDVNNNGNEAEDSDVNGSGETEPITLQSGENNPDIDAGIRELIGVPAALGNYVWSDVDEDGVQDLGELGIVDVTVTLLDENDNQLAQTTTDAQGFYQFLNLDPGTYVVVFSDLPESFGFTGKDTLNVGGFNDDTEDSDPDPSSGRTDPIVLVAGQTDNSVDAGLVSQLGGKANVGDQVWDDLDGDGIQDAGEPGVPGVTVTLFDANDNQVAQLVTDDNGKYQFIELEPGDYYIVFENIPEGKAFSPQDQGGDETVDSDPDPSGRTRTFTLAPNEINNDIDAGLRDPNPALASLGNFVWDDLNANGIQEDGEPAFQNVKIELIDSNGENGNVNGDVIAETAPDANGFYQFTDLQPGAYRVRFTVQDDTKQLTGQNAGTNDAIDSDAEEATGLTEWIALGAGENDDTTDAGVRSADLNKPNNVGNYVWHDQDGNGQQDEGEEPIEGVLVELLDEGDNVVASVATGPTGEYYFTSLPAGTYRVKFNLPQEYDGFTLSDVGTNDEIDSDADDDPNSPTFGLTPVFEVTQGTQNFSLDAGLIKTVTIGDFVWEDLNQDGIQDDGEPGVPDVTVTLINSKNEVIGITKTDANGFYLFDEAKPGVYAVKFELADYIFSPKDQGADDGKDSDVSPVSGVSNPVTLLSGQSDLTIDAGLIRNNARLGDFVWEDLNDNGVQDDGEPGVANVAVELRNTNGTVLRNTVTDANGAYSFDNLLPSQYVVYFTLPDGYRFTAQDQGGDDATDSDADPISGETITIDLAPGAADLTWDAGIVKLGSIGDFVWLDENGDGIQDDGETGVGDITVTLLDENDTPVATTTTDDQGQYIFEGLDAGSYTVVFSDTPEGVVFSPQDQGDDDTKDSDADTTGTTAPFTLTQGQDKTDVDTGLVATQPGIDVQKSTNGEDADAAPGPVVVIGSAVTWEYLVKNIGDTVLTKIALSDDKLGTIECPRVELSVGESMTCTAEGTAELGQYENTATVTSEPENQPNVIVTDEDQSHYFGESADLVITKTDDADPITPGDELTYTLVYTNNGPSDAVNVQIVDSLPFGVNFDRIVEQDGALNGPDVVPPASLNDGQKLVWTLTGLASGASGKIIFVVDTDLNLGGATIENKVIIDSETLDANPDNNNDEELTTFRIGGTNVCCPTAIELFSFMAVSRQGEMQVRWATVAEIGTDGYHLYRSEGTDFAAATKITANMVPGKSSLGGEYIYMDTGAAIGIMYNYWLVEVKGGAEQSPYGPTQAQVVSSGSAALNSGSFVFLPFIGR